MCTSQIACPSVVTELDVFPFLLLFFSFSQILLDGVPLLDLPGMLKYVATTHTHAPLTGERVPLTRLDQEESPARSLLLRIPNVHLRNVRFILRVVFSLCACGSRLVIQAFLLLTCSD